MKRIILLFITLLLSSCYSDDDNNFDNNKDDFNIIKKYWDQSLNKAIQIYDANSHAS